MLLRPWPSESIGEPVVFGADPCRLGSVVVDDLIQGVDAGHLEPVVVGRPAVLDEPKTSRRVRVNCDVLVYQLGTPNSDHKKVSKEFEIGDVKIV